jgi:hypothetical protein
MRLNQILDKHDFDGYLEGLCQRFYADVRAGHGCATPEQIDRGRERVRAEIAT